MLTTTVATTTNSAALDDRLHESNPSRRPLIAGISNRVEVILGAGQDTTAALADP